MVTSSEMAEYRLESFLDVIAMLTGMEDPSAELEIEVADGCLVERSDFSAAARR